MSSKIKEKSTFKIYSSEIKPVKKIANVLWFIFGGAISAFLELVLCVLLLFTIIGIPIGLQHYKCAKIHVSPFGKSVALHFSKHPILNVLYFIFGGFVIALVQYIIAGLCCLTIVGIPFGVVWKKIADLNIAPFGAEIVQNGHTTKSRDTSYDFVLLCNRIDADPKRKILLTNGEEGNATLYFHNLMHSNNDFFNAFGKVMQKIKIQKFLYYFITIVGFLISFVIFSVLLGEHNIFVSLIPVICYFVYFTFDIFILHNILLNHIYRIHLMKYFEYLFNFYTDSDSYAVCRYTPKTVDGYFLNELCYPGFLVTFYRQVKSDKDKK